MKKKYNSQFYIVMITGLLLSLVSSIIEFSKANIHSGIINLIVLFMFVLILVHKYMTDSKKNQAIKIVNWIILLFMFVGIAAESGVIFG